MKKFIAFLLVLCMILSLGTVAFAADKSSDIVILYTNDVHCGVDDAIGYAGLAAYKAEMEAANEYVTLVDCGDAIQGGPLGSLSKGQYIVEIMNEVGYDLGTFGNHEFDYGMDGLQAVIDASNMQYLSCNLAYTGTGTGLSGYKPYEIVEYGDVKVAFIGVSTPESIAKSTPTYFQDDNGNYVYNFSGTNTDPSGLYKAVQKTVDSVKNNVDYVVILSHLGIEEGSEPLRSYDLIANTTDIDVVIDGHSHSTVSSETVTDKAGEKVLLTQTGTKLDAIGKLTISGGKLTTELVTDYAVKDETVDAFVKKIQAENDELLKKVVAKSTVDLHCASSTGARQVRNRETGIGDLCADAYRYVTGADIAFVNGGGIRADIEKGDVTFANIIALHPYGNSLYVVKTSGQHILDALEWCSRNVTTLSEKDGAAVGENGGFLQVSGIKYTIDPTVKSTCVEGENGEFVKVAGARRISDVQVLKNGKYVALDPKGTYTLASHNYMLQSGGDGTNMFMKDEVVQDGGYLDNEVLIAYITEGLQGVIPATYANPAGRITVKTRFADVPTTHWAYNYIENMAEKKLLTGTSKTTFTPSGNMSRSMAVTMLYRLEGSPAVSGNVSATFSDCKDGTWYSDAVIWASENKIVTGYKGGIFKPDNNITRQEFAKILYDYAKAQGQGFTGAWVFDLSFNDKDQVASWADEGVHWCVMKGILSGKGKNIAPNALLTRAEAAAMLERFCTALTAAATDEPAA